MPLLLNASPQQSDPPAKQMKCSKRFCFGSGRHVPSSHRMRTGEKPDLSSTLGHSVSMAMKNKNR
jgi:hypothetical protein